MRIDILRKDDWEFSRKANHGRALTKKVNDRTLVTIVPETRDSLPDGTLNAILSEKQTRLGRSGLLELINKYGI